jgi:RimJ/RimL family protein N-acetyltransferase
MPIRAKDEPPLNVELRDGRRAVISQSLEEDAEVLLAFLDVVGAETDFLTFSTAKEVGTVEAHRAFFRVHLDGEKGLVLNAVIDGEVAASGTLMRGPRERVRHAAELGVCVRRSAWGVGLGRAMCEALIAGARCIGVTRVSLRVRADNERAIRLYELLGFVHEGRMRGAFVVGNIEYDELLMALRLRA